MHFSGVVMRRLLIMIIKGFPLTSLYRVAGVPEFAETLEGTNHRFYQTLLIQECAYFERKFCLGGLSVCRHYQSPGKQVFALLYAKYFHQTGSSRTTIFPEMTLLSALLIRTVICTLPTRSYQRYASAYLYL